jgi:hypothetical protein
MQTKGMKPWGEEDKRDEDTRDEARGMRTGGGLGEEEMRTRGDEAKGEDDKGDEDKGD